MECANWRVDSLRREGIPQHHYREQNMCEYKTGLSPEDGRDRLRLVKDDDGSWIKLPRVNR